jgi:hypothetical protein
MRRPNPTMSLPRAGGTERDIGSRPVDAGTSCIRESTTGAPNRMIPTPAVVATADVAGVPGVIARQPLLARILRHRGRPRCLVFVTRLRFSNESLQPDSQSKNSQPANAHRQLRSTRWRHRPEANHQQKDHPCVVQLHGYKSQCQTDAMMSAMVTPVATPSGIGVMISPPSRRADPHANPTLFPRSLFTTGPLL